MYIGSNVRYLRNKYKMTLGELARIMGYKSPTTVNKWEVGENTPPPKALEKLSQLFDVSVDQLLYKDIEYAEFTRDENPVSKAVRIKVYGKVPAGIPTEAIEDVQGYEDIPIEMTTGGREYFGLKVKGDSMYPKYHDGDIVIVRKQSTFESGQDCVVYINGYDATLKRVIREGDRIIIQPLNDTYHPRSYAINDEACPVTIAGVVVEIRRKV